VAASAGRAGQIVVVVDMTIGADPRGIRVGIRKRKTHTCVVKLGVQPGIRGVACFASRREARRHVVWVCCRLKIAGVAGIALGG